MALRPPSERATKLAWRVAELLMKEIYAGASGDPVDFPAEHWERLFGPKQSAVSNLHKLVETMSRLPTLEKQLAGEPAPDEVLEPISYQEFEVLKSWLMQEQITASQPILD